MEPSACFMPFTKLDANVCLNECRPFFFIPAAASSITVQLRRKNPGSRKIFYCRLLHFSEQPFWEIIAIMEILKIDKRFSKTVSLS